MKWFQESRRGVTDSKYTSLSRFFAVKKSRDRSGFCLFDVRGYFDCVLIGMIMNERKTEDTAERRIANMIFE